MAVARGNHDKACVGLEDLQRFNSVARSAALWTQDELTPENGSYVRLLPQSLLWLDGFQAVHVSPLNEDEYVLGAADASMVCRASSPIASRGADGNPIGAQNDPPTSSGLQFAMASQLFTSR